MKRPKRRASCKSVSEKVLVVSLRGTRRTASDEAIPCPPCVSLRAKRSNPVGGATGLLRRFAPRNDTGEGARGLLRSLWSHRSYWSHRSHRTLAMTPCFQNGKSHRGAAAPDGSSRQSRSASDSFRLLLGACLLADLFLARGFLLQRFLPCGFLLHRFLACRLLLAFLGRRIFP